jgi:hypothetical protein
MDRVCDFHVAEFEELDAVGTLKYGVLFDCQFGTKVMLPCYNLEHAKKAYEMLVGMFQGELRVNLNN